MENDNILLTVILILSDGGGVKGQGVYDGRGETLARC